MHVALVALGPSSLQYVQTVEAHGGRHAFCDKVWTVNSFGNVLDCDLIWHMDDVRVQEARAAAKPTGKIAGMLRWLKAHRGAPVMTSRAHPEYPTLIAYPLEDVLNTCPTLYFNSTPAYAIAYAIHIGVKQLSLFGLDYTWPNAHEAERGRACVEYWLGRAMQRGMIIRIGDHSTLMDSNTSEAEKFYGYDTVDVAVSVDGNRVIVTQSERQITPSAADIEARYDHSKPLH